MHYMIVPNYHAEIGAETEPVEGGYAIGQDFPIIPPALQPVQQVVTTAVQEAGVLPGAPPPPTLGPPNQCTETNVRGGVLRRCYDHTGRLISQGFGSGTGPGALVALRTGSAPTAAGSAPQVFVPLLQAMPMTLQRPTQDVFVLDARGTQGVAPPPSQGLYGPVTSPYEYD